MAKLTTKQRNRLRKSSFALPSRRYPIQDKTHARAALSRVAQHGSPAEQKQVRAAVHRKYPSIGGKTMGGKPNPGTKPDRRIKGRGKKPGPKKGR